MGTKMAVVFANIFMSAVEIEIIKTSKSKPLEWKRYIDDVFSIWDTTKEEIDLFILEANRYHPTIKFTAEISQREITSWTHGFYRRKILQGVCTRRPHTL